MSIRGSDPKLSALLSSNLPLIPSMDPDPSDRRFDRLMACLGLLDDAAPLFRSGTAMVGAGVLLAMPATTDYWVNDAMGEPLFVVTAEANAGLVKNLPALLNEARALLGERRLTVVFDRGGWSPKLFAKLVAAGFDLLTYRSAFGETSPGGGKGRSRHLPRSRFCEHKGVINGRAIEYTPADQGVHLLGGKLRLRQVTRLSENGHQTPILTSRRTAPVCSRRSVVN